jgi:hypothetical protein
MDENVVAVLIRRWYDGAVKKESRRELTFRFHSIGMKEFYQANSSDFHPELKLTLADYMDYENETLALYDGQMYRILRTYRNGLELELTLERAPDEEGAVNG